MDTGQDKNIILDKKLFKTMTDKPRMTLRAWIDYTKNTMSFGMNPNDRATIRISEQPQFEHFEFKDYVRPLGYRNALWEKKAISIDDARALGMEYTGHKAKDCFTSPPTIGKRSLEIEYMGPGLKDTGVPIYFAYDLHMKEKGTQEYYWIGPVIRNDGTGPGVGG